MPEIDTVIVGVAFIKREAKLALAELMPGEQIELLRENHRNDRNAIKVIFRRMQVGYVPRIVNPQIAEAMDAGAKPIARVTASAEFTDKGFCKREPKIWISW